MAQTKKKNPLDLSPIRYFFRIILNLFSEKCLDLVVFFPLKKNLSVWVQCLQSIAVSSTVRSKNPSYLSVYLIIRHSVCYLLKPCTLYWRVETQSGLSWRKRSYPFWLVVATADAARRQHMPLYIDFNNPISIDSFGKEPRSKDTPYLSGVHAASC
jgi:hypothetical protein